MAAIDDVWLCQQNIKRFQSRLSGLADSEDEQKLLKRLISHEQERLDQLASTRKSGGGAPIARRSEDCTSNLDEVRRP